LSAVCTAFTDSALAEVDDFLAELFFAVVEDFAGMEDWDDWDIEEPDDEPEAPIGRCWASAAVARPRPSSPATAKVAIFFIFQAPQGLRERTRTGGQWDAID